MTKSHQNHSTGDSSNEGGDSLLLFVLWAGHDPTTFRPLFLLPMIDVDHKSQCLNCKTFGRIDDDKISDKKGVYSMP